MAQDDSPLLTVTLTGKPPVKIKKEDWPVVAEASDRKYNNQYEFQANRKARWKLTVRQHKDGRTLVYAVYSYTTQWHGESDYTARGGELVGDAAAPETRVDTDAIIAAIQRVGAEIEDRVPASAEWGKGVFPRLVHECIASMPAVELT